MTNTQPVLHHAEEEKYGQSRIYESKEAMGLLRAALIMALWACAVALVISLGIWIYERYNSWTIFHYILIVVASGLMVGGLVLIKGLGEQLDGLRSYEHREAKSYAPPQPKLQLPAPQDSPFIVNPRHQPPYIAYRDGQTIPLLPDGRESRLALNPPTVAAILREVITHHGGKWSRDRLMKIQVNGERVTRSFYEKLTGVLAQSGFLQGRPTGGFELPHDIKSMADVGKYIPVLASDGGKDGGKAGTGGVSDNPPSPNRGEVLAQKYRELGCDVEAFLEWRRRHGV